MARRRRRVRRAATRSYTRARSYTRSRASRAGLKGLLKPMAAGVITGIAQSYIPNDALGGYADTLVPIGVGWYMNDPALQTIGAYQLGIKVANQIGAPKTSSGGGVY